MPRFVLLYHDCPPHYSRPSHWDFMLEAGNSLRTWALEKLPRGWHAAQSSTARTYQNCASVAGVEEVAADELGRHRRDYLEYEGDVSNNRGRVIRIATGTYTSESETPNCWQLTLIGDAISGRITLSRSQENESVWTLTFLPAN
jgi:hypothetical protein